MPRRKDNPARKAVPTPPVPVTITPEDIAHAREAWRKHAPRKFWGLVDATPAETPLSEEASKSEGRI